MKRIVLPICTAFSVLALFYGSSCNNSKNKVGNAETENQEKSVQLAETEPKTLSPEELVSKGEHLVAVTGCDDCHSPKKYENGIPSPDMALRLSGHQANMKLEPYDQATLKNGYVLTNSNFTAWIGPWGTSYAANITSDETGIGNWSEEQFIKSIREGKQKGLDQDNGEFQSSGFHDTLLYFKRKLSYDNVTSLFVI